MENIEVIEVEFLLNCFNATAGESAGKTVACSGYSTRGNVSAVSI